MSPDPPREPLSGLDPEAAARAARRAADGGSAGSAGGAGAGSAGGSSPLHLSPRRVQIGAGVFALVLVVVFSVLQVTSHGHGDASAGVAAGARLRPFAVPLATSTLVGDANLSPPCTAARHDPRALNTCLLLRRAPLVIDFFATDSSACERSVDALQRLAPRTPRIGFAAVAIGADAATVRAAIRRHRWTIPVAYDRDGSLGESLGIAVCPLIELVRRGGIVAERLVGDRWESGALVASALGPLLVR